MIDDDRHYFERRAETQLELAQRTTNADACRAHYLMADQYLALAYEAGAADPDTDADPVAD